MPGESEDAGDQQEQKEESSFGPSPRENVSHCQRGKMEEREWR